MSENNYPKLHNAMWPGLVGKKSMGGDEADISLDQMLDLTARAEVNGVKFDGVDIRTSYGMKSLGHADFAPIYQELDRRKAIVYCHPHEPVFAGGLIPGVSGATIEFCTDSTRAISLHLSLSTNAHPEIDGVTLGHHDASHHGQEPSKLEQLALIEDAEMKVAVDFTFPHGDTNLRKLETRAGGPDATPSGGDDRNDVQPHDSIRPRRIGAGTLIFTGNTL